MKAIAKLKDILKKIKFHLTLILIVDLSWIIYMIISQHLDILKHYWEITVTMVLGAFIAGSTSVGGGAIGFPVMTLIFKTPPDIARNFSFAIQSIGMTAASIIILTSKIKIEKRAILFSGIGGLLGIIFGTYNILPHIPAKPVKLVFVTIWLGFGVALWLVNRNKNREIRTEIHNFSRKDAVLLICFGFIGGMITSIFGSGIDTFTFCILALYYKMCEKVATQTSVVLMTVNTIFGFIFHVFVVRDFQPAAFNYWLAAIPVVVIFAPLGSLFVNKFSRNIVRYLLYFILVLEFVFAFVILKPDQSLIMLCTWIFLTTTLFFYILYKIDEWKSKLAMKDYKVKVSAK